MEIHLCTFAMCSTLSTQNGLFALRVCVCAVHIFVNTNDHVHFRALPQLWLGIHVFGHALVHIYHSTIHCRIIWATTIEMGEKALSVSNMSKYLAEIVA